MANNPSHQRERGFTSAKNAHERAAGNERQPSDLMGMGHRWISRDGSSVVLSFEHTTCSLPRAIRSPE